MLGSSLSNKVLTLMPMEGEGGGKILKKEEEDCLTSEDLDKKTKGGRGPGERENG